MERRTKIVATIGPASDSPEQLEAMARAGMDVARLGLAHAPLDESLDRFQRIRAVEKKSSVGRSGCSSTSPDPRSAAHPSPTEVCVVTDGQPLRLSPGHDESTAEAVEVDYGGLLTDLHVGDRLTFGDGSVVTEVVDHGGDALITRICHGGELQGRPGLHIPSDRLGSHPHRRRPRMIDAFVEVGVDMVALSFVRSAHDVRRVGTEPFPRGPLVVAKIETRAAVDNLDDIVEEADGIMVARGDLGVEMPARARCRTSRSSIIRDCIAAGSR